MFVIPGVQAQLGVEPGTHDLGALGRDSNTSVAVVLRNGGDEAITVDARGENLEGATLTTDPTSFALGAGEARSVSITLRVPADAAPGTHTPVLVASARADGDGNQAIGAVQVQLSYRVEVVDVAYAAALANDTVFVRLVNGHDNPREVTWNATIWNGAVPVENTTFTATLDGPSNALRYWPLASTYPDGTYRLTFDGTATDGIGPEAFDAAYTLSRTNGTFQSGSITPATSGGGGGGPPDMEEEPRRPGGGGGAPILTYPVPDRETPQRGEASRPVGGSQDNQDPVEPVHVLPRGLETLLDSVTYSLVAAAIALAAGVAVFVARGRLFH